MSLLRALLARPDTRDPDAVARDIADEFEFHIECATRQLVDEGLDPDQARRRARARFGDADAWVRRCTAIALEERRMLQRFNTALMVVVLLLVVGASVQMYLTQRRNAAVLADISAELAALRPAIAAPDPVAASKPSGIVYIGGDVARVGLYNFPVSGRLTLRRLITAAGGIDRIDDGTVAIAREGGDLPPINLRDLLIGRAEDPLLEPNDLVFVNGQGGHSPQSGLQREVDLLVQSLLLGEQAIPYTPNPELEEFALLGARRALDELRQRHHPGADHALAELARRFPDATGDGAAAGRP